MRPKSFGKGLDVGDGAGPQPDARRFVGVGRADAALSGAERTRAQLAFACAVERDVPRQQQVRGHVNLQTVGVQIGPVRVEFVHFARERTQVNHHARAQRAHHVRVKRARRNQVSADDPIAHGNGVAGIVAAVVAGHDTSLRRQFIGDVALALIAPLSAQ